MSPYDKWYDYAAGIILGVVLFIGILTALNAP